MKILRKALLITIIVFFCMAFIGYGCAAIEPNIPEYTFNVDSMFAVILNISGVNVTSFVAEIAYDPAYLQYMTYNVHDTNPFEYYTVRDSSYFVYGAFTNTNDQAISVNANIFEAAFVVKQEGETFVKLRKAIGNKYANTPCDSIQIIDPEAKIIGKAISVIPTESSIIFKLIFEKR